MASVFDCVVLSEDVYEDQLTRRAAALGWTRVHPHPSGWFYACHYRRGSENVIAYRGTNDLGDVVADGNMVPGIGRVPPSQVSAAVQVFDNCAGCTVNGIGVVTGHSLGGALAKVVSQKKNIMAVAFNAPFIGDLGGTVPMSSSLIRNYNAVGDPVSGVTGALGALPEGGVEPVSVRPPGLLTALSPAGTLYHYHSVETLREAMEHSARYRQPL